MPKRKPQATKTATRTRAPKKVAKVKEKPGRKPRLTPKFLKEFLTYFEQGNTAKTACACMDISEQAYWQWMKAAELEWAELESKHGQELEDIQLPKTASMYLVLLQSIRRAKAVGKAKLIAQMHFHGKTNYKATAFLLERVHSTEFGRRIAVTGSEGQPLTPITPIISAPVIKITIAGPVAPEAPIVDEPDPPEPSEE